MHERDTSRGRGVGRLGTAHRPAPWHRAVRTRCNLSPPAATRAAEMKSNAPSASAWFKSASAAVAAHSPIRTIICHALVPPRQRLPLATTARGTLGGPSDPRSDGAGADARSLEPNSMRTQLLTRRRVPCCLHCAPPPVDLKTSKK